MFFVSTVLGEKSFDVEQASQAYLPSFPAVAHRHIEEDQETKALCLVS